MVTDTAGLSDVGGCDHPCQQCPAHGRHRHAFGVDGVEGRRHDRVLGTCHRSRPARKSAAIGLVVGRHHSPLPVELPHAHHAELCGCGERMLFTAPDHEYPSHLELRLTATDATRPAGQRVDRAPAADGRAHVPDESCRPAARGQRRNADAPFSRTVIVGSSNSVTAPSPQQIGAQTYQFSAWSDGLAANHNITAPASPATYTATYTQVVTPSGLVAAYGFNEGSGSAAADLTGRGHTGAISGAAWSASGQVRRRAAVRRRQRSGDRRRCADLDHDGDDGGSLGEPHRPGHLAHGGPEGNGERPGVCAVCERRRCALGQLYQHRHFRCVRGILERRAVERVVTSGRDV